MGATRKTSEEVRRAIQDSPESQTVLAARYGINVKTVQKWRRRTEVTDKRRGPTMIGLSSLNMVEQSIVVSFRRHSLLPLDDCLYALQATIPQLTRSSLHRCLKRYGLSRLDSPELAPQAGVREIDRLGHLGLYTAQVVACDTSAWLFMAIDRGSKWMIGQVQPQADAASATRFLDHVLAVAPFVVHTVTTGDNRIFGPAPGSAAGFADACARRGCRHIPADFSLPLPGGRVPQSSAISALSRARPFQYQAVDDSRQRMEQFIHDYNHGRKLKALHGLTPREFILRCWHLHPARFRSDPTTFLRDRISVPPLSETR